MEKKEDFLFGSQQLIRIYLEQMLSRRFIRRTRNVSASDCGVLSLFH